MPGFLPAIRTTELVWLNHDDDDDDDDGVEDHDDDVRDGSDDFPAHSLLTKATQTPKYGSSSVQFWNHFCFYCCQSWELLNMICGHRYKIPFKGFMSGHKSTNVYKAGAVATCTCTLLWVYVGPERHCCLTCKPVWSDKLTLMQGTLNWKASFQLVPWFNWSPKLGKYEYKGPGATIVRVDYIKWCQMQTNR